MLSEPGAGEPGPAPPAAGASRVWVNSPHHGQIDGSGRVIPCRCRFDGQQYRLDETACIRGERMRCDLHLNNTSWVTTGEACDQRFSRAPRLPPG